MRNAEKLWAALALELVRSLPGAELKIVDAKPLPIAKGKRASWAKCLEASKGFSTMGMVYGFKLHALVNEQGLFERWSFVSAQHHEAAVAPDLADALRAHQLAGQILFQPRPTQRLRRPQAFAKT